MSHATVTVLVSAERLAKHHGDLDAAIAEMMAPFEESTEDERFLSFHDTEDENRKRYETGSTEHYRTPDGKLLLPWDERFRVPGTFGSGSDTHKKPADCESVEVPFREKYATFDAFCRDWCGEERDPKTGRYGYWRNPNKTWDWYTIGGRWTGFYPLKADAVCTLGESGAFGNKPEAGHGDIVRVSELDLDTIATKTREAAERFYAAYTTWLAAPTHDWDSPRSRAMTIGLVRVERKTVEAGANEVAIPWAKWCTDERQTWTDVAKVIDRDTLMRDYIDCFNPIVTYAALDDSGWHAPGTLGWFGCSSDEPDEYLKFHREFVQRFVKTAKATDLLVVVDYHI